MLLPFFWTKLGAQSYVYVHGNNLESSRISFSITCVLFSADSVMAAHISSDNERTRLFIFIHYLTGTISKKQPQNSTELNLICCPRAGEYQN